MNADKIPAKLRLQHLQCLGCEKREIYYNMNKYYGMTDGEIQAMMNENQIEEEQQTLKIFAKEV